GDAVLRLDGAAERGQLTRRDALGRRGPERSTQGVSTTFPCVLREPSAARASAACSSGEPLYTTGWIFFSSYRRNSAAKVSGMRCGSFFAYAPQCRPVTATFFPKMGVAATLGIVPPAKPITSSRPFQAMHF